MKTKWLLETDVFHENLSRLAQEIRKQGMEVKIASYMQNHYLDLFHTGDCVVFYGSLNFAAQVAREATWIPGVYYNKENFLCTHYYPCLYDYILNQDYVAVPYGELLKRQNWLYKHLGQENTIFIRPNGGSKLFTGKLIYKEYYEKDILRLAYDDIKPHELCIVAEPVNIEEEWRFVVVDKKVITGSQYKPTVAPEYPADALAIANKVAADSYEPDKAYCVDICKTRSGNYHLLEINSFSCSGFYACELEPIVREVSTVALKEWQSYAY